MWIISSGHWPGGMLLEGNDWGSRTGLRGWRKWNWIRMVCFWLSCSWCKIDSIKLLHSHDICCTRPSSLLWLCRLDMCCSLSNLTLQMNGSVWILNLEIWFYGCYWILCVNNCFTCIFNLCHLSFGLNWWDRWFTTFIWIMMPDLHKWAKQIIWLSVLELFLPEGLF